MLGLNVPVTFVLKGLFDIGSDFSASAWFTVLILKGVARNAHAVEKIVVVLEASFIKSAHVEQLTLDCKYELVERGSHGLDIKTQ